jgi:hypothetical protein
MKAYLLAGLLLTGARAFAQTAPATTEQEAGNIGALDAKNGFRSYKFGTLISDIPGLLKRDGGLYAAPKEPKKIGDIPLTSIRLVPHNGKLTGVILRTSGEKNIEKLLEVFTLQYGAPQQVGVDTKVWRGDIASMLFKTDVTYIGYGVTMPNVLVYITSNDYLEDIDLEKRSAAKKAADDL